MTLSSETCPGVDHFVVNVHHADKPSPSAIRAVRRAYAAIKNCDATSWDENRERDLAMEIEQILLGSYLPILPHQCRCQSGQGCAPHSANGT
jgi:hypothetical protein